MRKPILLALLLTSSIAAAETGKDLGPNEVRTHLGAIDAQIGQCFVSAVGDGVGGKLEVTLAIHRKGIVDSVRVHAPRVAAKTVAKVDACVRAALDGFTFPARQVGTTAVLPYVWQKTLATGAGPQESCWDAKGCKTTSDDDATATHPVAKPKTKVSTDRQARRAPRAS